MGTVQNYYSKETWHLEPYLDKTISPLSKKKNGMLASFSETKGEGDMRQTTV